MKTKDEIKLIGLDPSPTSALFRTIEFDQEDIIIELSAYENEEDEMCYCPRGDVVEQSYKISEITLAFADFNEYVKKDYDEVSLAIYNSRNNSGDMMLRFKKNKIMAYAAININDISAKSNDKLQRIQKIVEEQ